MTHKALPRLVGLLPGNELVLRAVNEECRRLVISKLDLGKWAASLDLPEWRLRQCGPINTTRIFIAHARVARQAGDYDGQCLCLPIHVQDNAAAWVLPDADVCQWLPRADGVVRGNLQAPRLSVWPSVKRKVVMILAIPDLAGLHPRGHIPRQDLRRCKAGLDVATLSNPVSHALSLCHDVHLSGLLYSQSSS